MNTIESRLNGLGHELPDAPAAVGSYVPALQVGSLVITSGQLPFTAGELVLPGRIGSELTVEQGQQVARICVLNGLSQIKEVIGNLDRISRIVRVEGYIHSAAGFTNQPQVLNGASDLLVGIFGETGKHTRIAIGVSEMPLNAAVQLAIWAEFAD